MNSSRAGFEGAAMALLLGENERGHHHLLIEFEQRALLEELIDDGARFGMIHGEQTLVEQDFGR